MKTSLRRLLYWIPRILCILYAFFISLFALDVFGEGKGPWETALSLLLHLIPTAIILAALLVSWRKEGIGGMLFVGLGILYVTWTRGRLTWSTYAMIAGPLVLTGTLFILNWYFRREIRNGS